MKESAPSTKAPVEIPDLELTRQVGLGGFGQVWIASEPLTKIRKAVKIVSKNDPARATLDLGGVQTYQQAAINHPHLVQIGQVGENSSYYYYVMEAADDAAVHLEDTYQPATLRTVLRSKRIEPRESLLLIRKLLSAIERLSAHNLSHNDLKPENVLIVKGSPKIADVGLVADTNNFTHAGSPAYITPEGQPDDLYALGKILYESLTGNPASVFPSLPKELADNPTPTTKAAIRIMNKAASRDPSQRFKTVAAFVEAVEKGLDADGRWVRNGLRTFFDQPRPLWISELVALLVFTVAASYNMVREQGWRLIADTPTGWTLTVPHSLVSNRHRGCARINGERLADAGVHALKLSEPVEHFVMDMRFRTRRPWGTLRVGLGSRDDRRDAVMMNMTAVPDGVEPQMDLYVYDLDPEFPITRNQLGPLIGQPLHGVEYAVRIARCMDGLRMAVWPLATTVRQPFIKTISDARGPDEVNFILIETATADPYADIEVLSLRVYDAGHPLVRVDESPLPFEDAQLLAPVPRPLIAVPPEELHGNLLTDFHPLDSDLWTSIGYWAWWSEPGPSPAGDPKPIRCVPFSTERRSINSLCATYGQHQLLRFDGAEFGDFSATLRINLQDPEARDARAHGTNVCDSSSYVVGMMFRMQDDPTEGFAWGGGYAVWLHFTTTVTADCEVVIARWDGARVNYEEPGLVHILYQHSSPEDIHRTPFHMPGENAPFGGFDLTVTARGPEISVLVNDKKVTSWVDPAAKSYVTGRIGLVTYRMIATFESLKIEPL